MNQIFWGGFIIFFIIISLLIFLTFVIDLITSMGFYSKSNDMMQAGHSFLFFFLEKGSSPGYQMGAAAQVW